MQESHGTKAEAFLRAQLRELLDKIDAATSVREVESLRQQANQTLLALAECRGASRTRRVGSELSGRSVGGNATSAASD